MKNYNRSKLSTSPNRYCIKPIQYTTQFNIKNRILNKINLNVDFKIDTLDDISLIQVNFCKTFRFDNSDLLFNGSIYPSNENCIKRVLDDGFNDTCGVLSIVFGNFLTEMGLNVRLIKTTLTKYKGHHNHYFNLLKWKDNKEYIVDVAVGFFNPFYPVEIGGDNIISKNNTSFRCRRAPKDEEIGDRDIYILESQSQLPGKNNNWFVVFCFDNNTYVSMSTFSKSEEEYRGNKQLIIYILFDEGSYFLTKDNLLIKYHNGNNINIPILSLNHFLEISYKYFKINNFNILKELFLKYKQSKL